MKNIKNIVFDFGDVIINIDLTAPAHNFAYMAQISTEESMRMMVEKEVFKKFEIGALSSEEFRDYVRQVFRRPNWTDSMINDAWNSVLLDMPADRIEKIKALGQKGYRLFMLSNTSPIHIEAAQVILKQVSGVAELSSLFEKLYLSYQIGITKPDAAIYDYMLTDAGLVAEETLFLDDNVANIEAAKKAGIQTILVQKPTSIVEYLENF